MAEIDPYIRVLFLRDVADTKIPSGHRRREEMLPALLGSVEGILKSYGAPATITNIGNFSEHLFDELVQANVISVEDHGFAGAYCLFNVHKYNNFRTKVLEKDPIFQSAERVGGRYFPDMFKGYMRQQTKDAAEDALRGSIVVPASDRIVSIGDNSALLVEEIEQLKRRISTDNDPDEKLLDRRERLVSELSAGQELLKAPSVRVRAVLAVLVSTLGFIAAEFAGGIIGDLAVKLLEQIKPIIGL